MEGDCFQRNSLVPKETEGRVFRAKGKSWSPVPEALVLSSMVPGRQHGIIGAGETGRSQAYPDLQTQNLCFHIPPRIWVHIPVGGVVPQDAFLSQPSRSENLHSHIAKSNTDATQDSGGALTVSFSTRSRVQCGQCPVLSHFFGLLQFEQLLSAPHFLGYLSIWV